jgi:ElaB/YqjD/DUF883 family membrane-anchored ribosome-binding protein
MTKKRNPEERSSVSGASAPGGVQPHPTGQESLNPEATAGPAPPRQTDTAAASGAEPAAEGVAGVQAVAAEYYEKLTDTATQLAGEARRIYSDGADYARANPFILVGGGFVAGLLLGVFSVRR